MTAVGSDYDDFRMLLLEDERRRLSGIDQALARVDRRLDALPDALAESIESANRAGASSRLARALSESTAESLELAVRKRPEAVVHAMFPVIGPAIRRALGEALRNMAHDFDQALVDTLGLKVLRWRFEAWRTGVPYALVALRHRLRYQVEHLFLIQQDTGLLLDYLSMPGVSEIDPDAVAGMLTAIAQFVRDSVHAEGSARLESATVGEYRLVVSEGPLACLAALVRGIPPSTLAMRLDEVSEELQAQHGWNLSMAPESADGGAGFLDPHFLTELHQVRSGGQDATISRRYGLWLVLLAILLGAGSYWLWSEWQWSQRVRDVRSELTRLPGFVLLQAQSLGRGELAVSGLFDPTGGDPRKRFGANDLRIAWSVQPYISSAPDLIARRASQVLGLNPTMVRGPNADGVLSLVGTVPYADWRRLHDLQPAIPGVARLDTSGLSYPRAHEFKALAAQIEDMRIAFTEGIAPTAEAAMQLQKLQADIERLQLLAADAGILLRLRAFGMTDEPGSSLLNRDLRMRRAEWLTQRLAPALNAPTRIEVDMGTLSALDFHGVKRAALIRIERVEPTAL